MFYKPPVVLCIKLFNKMQYLNYVKLPQIIIILFSFAHKFLEIRIKQPTSTNVANTDKIMSLSNVKEWWVQLIGNPRRLYNTSVNQSLCRYDLSSSFITKQNITFATWMFFYLYIQYTVRIAIIAINN